MLHRLEKDVDLDSKSARLAWTYAKTWFGWVHVGNQPPGGGEPKRTYWLAKARKAISDHFDGAVKSAKGGSVEYRAEKTGIVHAGIGKASFEEAQLLENARAFIEAIQRAKPTGAKGTYVKKVAVGSSMGPGVKVDVASLAAA